MNKQIHTMFNYFLICSENTVESSVDILNTLYACVTFEGRLCLIMPILLICCINNYQNTYSIIISDILLKI